LGRPLHEDPQHIATTNLERSPPASLGWTGEIAKESPRIAEAYEAIMDRMLQYSMALGMEQTLANAEYKQLIDALDDLRELRKPQGRSSVSL
jgi:hypothetical protein